MQTETTQRVLNPQNVPLIGFNLIEASAGTGKTWTISWLYLRLIAISGMWVDRILVVTYTNSATQELRDRIRKRLVDALAYLEGRPCDEAYETLKAELASEDEIEMARRRLQRAVLSFDEAAIFTIHGFCKRVLSDHAFEAQLKFNNVLQTDEEYLLQELTDNFWHASFYDPTPENEVLLQQGISPDKLLQTVIDFIPKPYLVDFISEKIKKAPSFTKIKQKLDAKKTECAQCFFDNEILIINTFQHKSINKKIYVAKSIGGRVNALRDFFSTGVVVEKCLDIVVYFSARKIQLSLNKDKSIELHPFFEKMDELLDLLPDYLNGIHYVLENKRLELLVYLRTQLPLRKQRLGVLGNNDVLIELEKALNANPVLTARLAEKYEAALIDEFQDTDPIQYNIFSKIYSNTNNLVFFVGDPKQAIYGFRGADINTYLKASNYIDAYGSTYTLGKNYRTHEKLIQAINYLFTHVPNPFRNKVAYMPVSAGKEQDTFILHGQEVPPFKILNDGEHAFNTSAEVEQNVADAVAQDIASLLLAAQNNQALIGGRPVKSNDIAVLVNKHKQGEQIRAALLKCGIASVLKTKMSIFETHEAKELILLLEAIAQPKNLQVIRRAMSTELYGATASTILHCLEADEPMDAVLNAFNKWHELWLKKGFVYMIRQFLLDKNCYVRLLSFVDGERRLTNILHLIELLHSEVRITGTTMSNLILWLRNNERIILSKEGESQIELRLESDEDLIQILTIHKSKGLEYGIVYCPFLWKSKDKKHNAGWLDIYDEEKDITGLHALSLSENEKKLSESKYNAERAEQMRLLYVALTRAKYRCTVVVKTALPVTNNGIKLNDSSLNWLLFGGLKGYPSFSDNAGLKVVLQNIQAEQPDLIALEMLNPEISEILSSGRTVYSGNHIRTFNAEFAAIPKVGSFSVLSKGHVDERPDYDAFVWQKPELVTTVSDAFPRGAMAGSCLHGILETLDFCQPLVEQEALFQENLEKHGIAKTWYPQAVTLLGGALHTPLLGNFTLAQLPKQRRLDELEFYFPVCELELGQLQRLLHAILPAEWGMIHVAVDKLRFDTLNGLMKGFVDLVFEHEQLFYVVDYKSNDLGEGAQAYTSDALQQAMAEHHYYLQYLIYCVALHRYLGMRVAKYAWDTHVGGVMYLFLRGMVPEQAQSGVFFTKPSAAHIAALDVFFRTGRVELE